jgi:hypothetical protein
MRAIRFEPPQTQLLILILVLTATVTSTAAQTLTPQQSAPVKIVEEFWKVETTGGRLTPEGWYKASAFFIRSGPHPGNKTVTVIRNGLADKAEETARTATWAEVSVSTDILGQIDSSLRFKPSPKDGIAGVHLIKGPVVAFDLVLSDKQWKFNQDGARGKESDLTPQWLITCGSEATWINLDPAIAYVKEMGTKTTDPSIRKNAGETVQQLRRLQ